MGAYLDKPETGKLPIDESSDTLEYGASSMQGWRTSQEDEHNCCLKFDSETSMFAVYDGHGGGEVAQYTAKHFPDFIRALQSYKDGQISEALVQAFLDFDATLREEKVQETLKSLAGLETDEEDEEEKEKEAAKLFEEADMPLDQLMQRYKSRGPLAGMRKLKKDKSQSPYIRSKKDVPLFSRPDPESGDIKCEPKLVNGRHNDVKSDSVPDSSASEAKPASITHNKANGSSCNATSASSSKDNTSTGSPSKSEASQSNHSSQSAVSQSESKVEEVSCSSNDSTAKSTDVHQEEDGVVGSSASASSSVVTSSVGADSSSVTVGQEAASSSQGEPCSSSGSPSKQQGGSGTVEDEESFDEETSEEEEHSDDEVDTGKVKWWKFGEGEDDDDSDSEEEDDEDGEGPFEDDDDDDDEESQEVITGGEEPGYDSGCTAVVTMLRGRQLYVANAGDSRCVLCRGGKSVDLSEDHKPEDPIEKSRIIKAGGRITADGRVNGGLNLSRAIGDHRYKLNETIPAREQMISALPDITVTTLQEDDEFLIVACDGIWNAMSSQDVVTFVRDRIQAGIRPISAIAGEMFELCLAPNTKGDGTGCDNMTCIIVNFKPTPTGTSEADPKPSCTQATAVKAPDSDVTVDSTVCSKRKVETLVDVDTSANKKTRVDDAQVDEADSSG